MAVYVLALALRLGYVWDAHDNPLYHFIMLDERSQHEVAVAVCEGALPPNAPVKAPFYSYALGMLYRLVGVDTDRARIVQICLVSLCPVLVYAIADRLLSFGVAVLAGILASVFWTFIFFSAELLDVSLACLMYLLLAYVLVAVDDRSLGKWLLAGLLIGLGAITRPNILAFAPVCGVLILLVSRQRQAAESARPSGWLRFGAVRALLLLLGTTGAIAPVTIRNAVVANDPVLIAFFGGYNLYVANNPTSDGKNAISPKVDLRQSNPGLDLNDPWVKWDEGFQAAYLYAAKHMGGSPTYAEAERFYVRLTMDYLRRYPGKFARDTLKRLCWIFNAYEYPSNKDLNYLLRFSGLLSTLSWLHFGIIGPIGVVGFVMLAYRERLSAPAVYYMAMILTLALPGAFFVVNARYRLPFVYLLMPLVAWALIDTAQRVAGRRDLRRVAGRCGLAAALAILANVNWFGYRPPAHDYMLFSYAGACGAAGRDDLMAEAIKDIERALADDSYDHALHPWAMTCLFTYYRDQTNLDKAAHYGRRILDRDEPVGPLLLASMVQAFVKANDLPSADQAMKLMLRRAGSQVNLDVAEATLAYGKARRDRQSLKAAAVMFQTLAELHPTHETLRRRLLEARRLLKRTSGNDPTSLPAPDPS